MVSGYCKCGFPASERCPECGEKLCGNCFPKHKCREEYVATVPAPAIIDEREPTETPDAPAPVTAYKKKPGRPPNKK